MANSSAPQYFDKETNLHYNYFRDYGPAEGRYIQADPLGIAGLLSARNLLGQDTRNVMDLGLGVGPAQLAEVERIHLHKAAFFALKPPFSGPEMPV